MNTYPLLSMLIHNMDCSPHKVFQEEIINNARH